MPEPCQGEGQEEDGRADSGTYQGRKRPALRWLFQEFAIESQEKEKIPATIEGEEEGEREEDPQQHRPHRAKNRVEPPGPGIWPGSDPRASQFAALP